MRQFSISLIQIFLFVNNHVHKVLLLMYVQRHHTRTPEDQHARPHKARHPKQAAFDPLFGKNRAILFNTENTL
jgi:hypothetical protein